MGSIEFFKAKQENSQVTQKHQHRVIGDETIKIAEALCIVVASVTTVRAAHDW